jgi:8-amino-7-oxononanoate synthase
MRSLDDFAREKLDALAARDARRRLRPGTGDARRFTFEGRSFVAFASNDYLGLAGHPAVCAAARAAVDARGLGSTASRLVVGDGPEHQALEADLAALKGTAAACVFGSGYHANLGIIPSLAGPDDVIFVDALAHACLRSGARLSRAHVVAFPHDDVDALQAALHRERSRGRRALVLTEGVFSMDGDRASLREMAALSSRHDAWLLVDDAHATGVIGPEGSGSVGAAGLEPSDVPLQVGTLSKALGAYGGFLGASRPVVDLMVTRARTLIYSTALPPSVVAAARAALAVARAEPERRARATGWARHVAARLGLPHPAAAVLPVLIGGNASTLRVHRRLLEQGLFVPAMRPPTVPEGTARLRLSFSALHTEDDVERLVAALEADDEVRRGLDAARPPPRPEPQAPRVAAPEGQP